MPQSKKDGPQQEFRRAVRRLAVDTAEVFKDDRMVWWFIREGNFVALADEITQRWIDSSSEFSNHDIVDAAAGGAEGLLELAIDAAHALHLTELSDRWAVVTTTKQLLPSLNWPKGFKAP